MVVRETGGGSCPFPPPNWKALAGPLRQSGRRNMDIFGLTIDTPAVIALGFLGGVLVVTGVLIVFVMRQLGKKPGER